MMLREVVVFLELRLAIMQPTVVQMKGGQTSTRSVQLVLVMVFQTEAGRKRGQGGACSSMLAMVQPSEVAF